MNAITMALLGLSYATELPPIPEPPVRAADHVGDCTSKAPAVAGSQRDCRAVSTPPSYLAYLEEQREYSAQLRVHLVAVRAVAAVDATAAASQIDWRDQQLEREFARREPRPVLEIVGYVALGSAMTLGAGWALGQITQP